MLTIGANSPSVHQLQFLTLVSRLVIGLYVPLVCWCCWFGMGCWYHACETKTWQSWEEDTPNPKLRRRQRETTQAKIFPRYDMSKGKTCSVINLP